MSKYYIAPKEVSPGVELGVSLGLGLWSVA